jgi:methionyl-tRNA formyltransferase
MRVAFAGTPEFAAVALRALHGAGFDIPLVLTQPDRPAGRGQKLQTSAVKQFALAQGLPVAQPRSLKLDGRFPEDAQAARAALAAAAPDLMVVAAYGLILPAWALALPLQGCLNIHGSLLPRWRGAAPIHRAIEAGDNETGITIMRMEAGLDTGPMLLMEAERIEPKDTTGHLHDRLAALGARLIVRVLQSPLQPGQPQPEAGVTYAAKVDKAEARIDWRQAAVQIERRVRAFDPFPGAFFSLAGESIKLWRASVTDDAPVNAAPGVVLPAPAGVLRVACGQGALDLLELQRPGGRRSPVAAFLSGHPVSPGTALG